MIPLVSMETELAYVRKEAETAIKEVEDRDGVDLSFIRIGTMIELPRAAVMADEIAKGRRLLQLRHQRPDPDHVRLQPRRRRGQILQGL